MDQSVSIRGREKEIKTIMDFLKDRKSGTLYLTGPPGTGKTMSVDWILDNMPQVSRVKINCLRVASSKIVLQRICNGLGLGKYTIYNESEMIVRICKKITSRSAKPQILVLDELDQLPQSKNANLIKSIFDWPNLPNSRLILVGIANTVNLTARYQVVSALIGKEESFTKVLFRPYNSKEIKEILEWYLQNDENFEDELVEPKALDMIAKKFARENGDIRGALNALRSSIDDGKQAITITDFDSSQYPTPPATPQPAPCKEKTNIASVANSCKKRQKRTNYKEDQTPFAHQILLVCIMKLCSTTKRNVISARTCKDLAKRALGEHKFTVPDIEYITMFETLELQGLITVKRGRPMTSIILRASEAEILPLIHQRELVLDAVDRLI